jgi:hypothetical protein
LTPRISTGATPDAHDFEQLDRIHHDHSSSRAAAPGETETVTIEADPSGRFVDLTVTIFPR